MLPISVQLVEQALDRSLDIIFILEANHQDVGASRIVYANQTALDVFEYSQEEVIGNTPRMFQGKDTDKLTRMEIRVSLKHEKPLRSRILNFNKSGKPIWLDIHMVPLHNADGEVSHFFASERVVE